MVRKKEDLARQLALLKSIVKRKYRKFKQGVVESELNLTRQYKPLIDHLNTPLLKNEVSVKKEELKGDDNGEMSMDIDYGDEVEEKDQQEVEEGEVEEAEEEVRESQNDTSVDDADTYVSSTFPHETTKRYMRLMMKDNSLIDHTFGPRYEGNNLMVGNKKIEFDGLDILVEGGQRISMTPGVYELLFMKKPNKQNYKSGDLKIYKNILLATNAHKRKYNYKGTVTRDNSLKYKHIVKFMFPTAGKGMTKLYSSPDISYWDNPNELCDRLQLLVASSEVGNTGHRNEIINIIEELKEYGCISGAGNSRFKSLLR